jgi:hypothetical protein
MKVNDDDGDELSNSKGENMFSRRDFMNAVGAGLVGATLATAESSRASTKKKLAIVTTEWSYRTHAWHMGERFLVGYPIRGEWHMPPLEVISAYVDQTPDNDLSRQRAEEFGFQIHPTIAEALRAGGDRLAVDAVLVIGEHGKYPTNELGQHQYPRYEFFRQVTDVFREEGRALPVFNDKHLSWNWSWATEMVDSAHKLGVPFLAGSSLPVTWRMPSIDMPLGAAVDEALCLAMGGLDSYDFHALEAIQCMVERRRGGETGVVALQALRGDSVWQAMESGSWSAGGWNRSLVEACLCRSQTLAQPATFSHRRPTAPQMREFVKDPVAYRFEYADGLKATMLLMNGLVDDFTFAASIQGESKPLSTLFYLPPNPNVVYSAALMSKAEELFMTGKPPYPIERTLLTTGLVAAGMQSLAAEQKRIETPHLAIRYEAPQESLFWRS